jgi:hypothetical protein
MQGPGRSDEDTRDGFTHGGWAAERAGDHAITRAWGRRLAASSGYLLGRRTYQDVLGHWNATPACPGCWTPPVHRRIQPDHFQYRRRDPNGFRRHHRQLSARLTIGAGFVRSRSTAGVDLPDVGVRQPAI